MPLSRCFANECNYRESNKRPLLWLKQRERLNVPLEKPWQQPWTVVNKTDVPSLATRGSKVHSMQRSPALLVQSRLWWLRHPPFTREQTHLNTRGRLGSLGFKPEFVKLGQEIRVASVTIFHSARKPTSFQQFPSDFRQINRYISSVYSHCQSLIKHHLLLFTMLLLFLSPNLGQKWERDEVADTVLSVFP